MKIKLYYGALALLWLMCSCSGNIKKTSDGVDLFGAEEYVYKNHTYVKWGYGMAHSGNCKQCKFELDSIVRNAVKN